MEAEARLALPEPRKAWGHPELDEAREASSSEHLRRVALQVPDLTHVASRPEREHISVVLRHPVCGIWLQQPQETNWVSKLKAPCTPHLGPPLGLTSLLGPSGVPALSVTASALHQSLGIPH